MQIYSFLFRRVYQVRGFGVTNITMRKFLTILFITFAASGILFPGSSKIQFSHISVEQGLSHSTVLSIYQDKTGFMWFGTADGLNRYDGNDIKIYQANPNDPYSLSDNYIKALCGDKSGFLWIGTDNGLNRFDPRTEKFICYKNNLDDPHSLSDNAVRELFVDESGTVWVGTDVGGLNKFDPRTEKFIRYDIPAHIPAKRVFAICEDDSGFLWIGTNRGLVKFDPGTKRVICYRSIPGEPNSLSFDSVQSLHFDHNSGMLWIGTFGGGLSKFDPQREEFIHYTHDPNNPNSLSNNSVRKICKDQSDTLWLGTALGLNRFDIRKEEFLSYRHDPGDPNSLTNDFILSVYEDRSGAIWIGVRGGGINVFDKKLHKFLFYQHEPNKPNSLSNNQVWAFTEDEKGIIWIATESGGLNKFDPENETFTHYKHDPEDPESLSSDSIYSMCGSRFGKIWVGSTQGLNEFDPETGKAIHYKSRARISEDRIDFTSNSLIDDFVISVFEDRSGIVWIGTRFGLDRFDPVQKQFSHYRPYPNYSYSDTNQIQTIFEDTAGTLWVGTLSGGLNEFDREEGRFVKFTSESSDTKSLNYPITAISEDHSGILLVGTKGGGLHKISKAREIVAVYTQKDGLPNNIIKGVLEDDQGNLWISTTKGLSRYTLATQTFRNYSQRAGLQSYEFNEGAYYKSKTGEMYFGGQKGFNRFFPGKVMDNLYIPPIVITSVKITDKSKSFNGDLPLQKEIPIKDEIQLSYKDNIFSIEFAALDYTAPEKNQYKCMLEGFNEDYINLGYKNDITFTNLDPGKYTFRVMGTNNDGLWNAEGASIKIIITPPFTHTWFFRGLMILLFCGILIILHKLRTTRIKQDLEKKRLEKELRLKEDFTAMLVHDLRSPLTAIIGYSDMLNEMPDQMDVKKTGQVIHRSSEKMLALINDMLDLSKFEAGKMSMEKKEMDIAIVVTEIVEIITPLFNKKDIDLVCSIEPIVKEKKLSIDVERIGQVITNFLSNAAKFTPRKGKVVIEAFKTSDEFVQVSVTDNGPGVPPDRREFLFQKWFQFEKRLKNKGTGLGLAVSKLIIESHGGEIGYKPVKSGKGSTFYFKLPLIKRIGSSTNR